MFADMLLFMYLAWSYKSVEAEPEEEHHLIADAARKNSQEIKGLDNVAFTKDNKDL